MKTYQEILRNELKNGLAQCTSGEQRKFKRMYANGNLGLPIDEVVDLMSDDTFEWAMQQVQNSLNKKAPPNVLSNKLFDEVHQVATFLGLKFQM